MFLNFHPGSLGEDEPIFDLRIFFLKWVAKNHQLVDLGSFSKVLSLGRVTQEQPSVGENKHMDCICF